ncbi:DUF3288 family protein [Prochlorococcus sp. MIT 1307]|uniref:DUF3288 family protein n=1 Tax=Prochlorococcus sp. MIT 1307 TaxID=3096219 RepID=UPI002A764A6C|nr:DUF3288 family protein [Prochlorococcus sp. MIT 1307]
MKEQNHPLYSIDRDHIDRLLGKEKPEDGDIVDLARLMLRYEGFPGASDLHDDMRKTLKLWGLSRETLNQKARCIWDAGYRPGDKGEDVVGSGFDTKDAETI